MTAIKYLTAASLFLSSFCSALDDNLELLISPEQLDAKLTEVATAINEDYKDKNLTVVMVMKGSLCVTADLIRKITIPCKIEYLKASSYGYNGMTSGQLTIAGLETLEIEGRDLLIVDDILETGKTMVGIINKLKEKNPSSIQTLLLLVKDIPRLTNFSPDYALFHIEDRFVVGYGLDYKELYRGLPGIYAFVNDKAPF